MPDAIFIQRVTAFNLAYALVWSLFRRVYVWKLSVPALLAKRFQLLRAYDGLFTRDEWQRELDACWDAWRGKDLQHTVAAEGFIGVYRGKQLDFSLHAAQQLGVEFQNFWLFTATVIRFTAGGGGKPRVIPSWFAYRLPPGWLAQHRPGLEIGPARGNRWLEMLDEWARSTAHVANTVVFGLLSLGERIHTGSRRILWLGISPQEAAHQDDRLDFAWAARYGHVRGEEVAYFSPFPLSAPQRSHLERDRILCLDPRQTWRAISRTARLRALVAGLRTLACMFAQGTRPAGFLAARFMARAPLWDEIAAAFSSSLYITSTSFSWPEKPELAVMRARGIRSVIWAYSANALTFSKEAPATRDLGVARSIVIADEFWVWTPAYARWLDQRRVDGPGRPVVRGVMMCGDVRHLRLTPAAARARLGLPADGTFITAFDVPSVSAQWRARFGGGPGLIEFDYTAAFFDGLRRLLEDDPDLHLILKLKRMVGDWSRRFPEALHALLALADRPSDRRVHLVDVNVDPYLPLAAGDLGIGMTFTSPVLAMLATGRPAVYYDPLARANWPSVPELSMLTVQSYAALAAFVAKARTNGLAAPSNGLGNIVPSVPQPEWSL